MDSSHNLLCIRPCHVRQRPSGIADRFRRVAGGRAINGALGNALIDSSQAKHIESQVKIPVARYCEPGARAIFFDIGALFRNTKLFQVQTQQSAKPRGKFQAMQ